MHEDRRLVAERLEDPHVARRRGDPLVASGDVRDRHRVVVDGVGEVVGGEAVRLEQHEVVEQAVLVADLAADQVAERGDALARHAEADHVRLAAGGALRAPGGVEVAAGALVALRPAGGALALAHRAQVVRGAEAAVGVAVAQQRLAGGVVAIEALRLHVGAVVASGPGALVPLEAEPAQRVLDASDGALDGARLVGVLNASAASPRCVRRSIAQEVGASEPCL